MTGIDLVEDAPAPAELADLATEVQQEAELMLNADQTHVMRVVEAGINGDETLDDIVDRLERRMGRSCGCLRTAVSDLSL